VSFRSLIPTLLVCATLPISASAATASPDAAAQQLSTVVATPPGPVPSPCTAAVDRPRIGLVLGGGGARGIAHIGVIKMLEELHVPVDYVAGTSMGSLVAGMYATGMTSADLESVVRGIDWNDLFSDGTARADRPYRRKRDDDFSLFGPKFGVGANSSLLPKGAISGQKIRFMFESVTGNRMQVHDFNDLPIPYRAVAADVITGQPVVIDDGDLATAMRASMSIPGLFQPIERGDYLLVDGGIAKNLPVDVVKKMGADVIIAVDVGTPLSRRDQLSNFLAITGQLTSILIQRNTDEQKKLLTGRDVLIVPALGDDITSAGFQDATKQAIPIGYAGAEQVRDQLAALGVSEDAYRAHRAGIAACVNGPPTVEFVRLENHSRFSDSVLNERLHVRVGKPLDEKQMQSDIQQIYALGFLDTATYEVVNEDGRRGVVVKVNQDTRGTSFIETGVDFIGDSDSSSINVRIGYLKTDVDERGGEFRLLGQVGENQGLLAELYEPVDPDLRIIMLPRLSAQRRSFDIFDDHGDKVARASIEEYGGSFAIGRELGSYAAIFGGVRRYTGSASVDIGPPHTSDSYDGGEWFANATWDTLDDRYFPSTGRAVTFEYTWSETNLGASQNFEQLNASFFDAETVGRHTFLASARYGTTIQSDAPVQNLFTLGGPFRLSGLEQDQLTGQHYGMALLGYRLRLVQSGLLPPYAGATVEFGNAANERHNIIDDGIWNGNVYVGFNTFIGPLYAGYGFAEGGRRSYYLRIGTLVGGPSQIGR